MLYNDRQITVLHSIDTNDNTQYNLFCGIQLYTLYSIRSSSSRCRCICTFVISLCFCEINLMVIHLIIYLYNYLSPSAIYNTVLLKRRSNFYLNTFRGFNGKKLYLLILIFVLRDDMYMYVTCLCFYLHNFIFFKMIALLINNFNVYKIYTF